MPTLNRHFHIAFTKNGCSVRRYYQEQITSTIGDLTQTLVRQEGLPTLAYGLYRRNAADALDPAMLVEQLNEGEQLYLSNAPPPPQQHLPLVQPPPVPAPFRLLECTVEVVQGDEIVVPYSGLAINRSFLLDHLPDGEVQQIARLSTAGVSVPIMRASRKIHCLIAPHRDQWAVTAHHPTFCNGISLRIEHPYPLGGSSILTLGEHGSQIRVRVFQR